MRNLSLLLSLFAFCLPLCDPHAVDAQVEQAIQAGFAEKDITPEIGMEQPGGYGKSYHRTLHDPCKVKAGVFGTSDDRVAVVSVDALALRQPLIGNARERVQEQVGIAPHAVLIHATHSHSSGPTAMVLPGEYDFADEFVQELAYEKSSNANADYLKLVEDQIVAAVVEANEKLAPSKFSFGYGHEEQVAFNRRFLMKSGLTVTHPRQNNPDIVKPAGPIDPQVGVMGVWDEADKLKGCIVNYSCHATTNPGGISANYIYFVEKILRGVFGEDVVLVFIAGASGDVTQVDNRDPLQLRRGEESARFVGGRIGAEAVKVLLSAKKGDIATVAAKHEILKVPRRAPRPPRVETAYQLVRQSPKDVGSTEWTFAKETVLLDAKLKVSPTATAEIQALQIGPLVLVTDPAEYFCQYGLEIKAGSKFPFTFPASLTNGCVGYVPTTEAFGIHGGGYETRLSSYSNLEITAGDLFRDTGIKLANELTPDPVPARPRAPEFRGGAWGYGDVPPQVD